MNIYLVTVVAAFTMLVALSPLASCAPGDYSFSVSDPAGDVNDINVDIKEVKARLQGSEVIFDLVVTGSIIDSSKYEYVIWISSSPDPSDLNAPRFAVTYANGNATGTPLDGRILPVNATHSAHTLTFMVPISYFQDFTGFYLSSAMAIYTPSDGPQISDAVLPETGADNTSSSGGSGGGGSGDGVPGFETAVTIGALSFAGLAYTYRRNH